MSTPSGSDRPPVLFLAAQTEHNRIRRILGESAHSRIAFRSNLAAVTWKPDIIISAISFLSHLSERMLPRDLVSPARVPKARKSFVLLNDERRSTQAIFDLLHRFPMGELKGLRVFSEAGEAGERAVLTRILRVLSSCDPERRILSARWEERLLIVQSGAFRTVVVSRDEVAEAIGAAAKGARATSAWNFQLDPGGAFLYWKRFDAHVGWEQLEQAVDPGKRLKAMQASARFNLGYGKAIRLLRKEKGLLQKEIPGLTERQMRRIEHGEVRATLTALQKLARVHGMPVNRYMEALAERLPHSLR